MNVKLIILSALVGTLLIIAVFRDKCVHHSALLHNKDSANREQNKIKLACMFCRDAAYFIQR